MERSRQRAAETSPHARKQPGDVGRAWAASLLLALGCQGAIQISGKVDVDKPPENSSVGSPSSGPSGGSSAADANAAAPPSDRGTSAAGGSAGSAGAAGTPGGSAAGAGGSAAGAGGTQAGAGGTQAGAGGGAGTAGGTAGAGAGGAAGGAGGTTGGVVAGPVAFPLSISSDKRVLVDRNGAPFLLVGDTAWSLPTQLSDAETLTYLEDRKMRGFNTVLMQVMEHKFSSRSPAWRNAAGQVPFDNNNDFTTVRAAFFDHVAWVVEQANARGMLVLLTPAYIGYACGDEGWCAEMTANGVAKLTQYGQFIGQRFKSLPNVIWVQGGDLTPSTSGSPSQLDLVNAVALGVKAGDGGAHLHTAHWNRGDSSSQGPAVTWLDIDATYAGSPRLTFRDSLDDWSRDAGKRPALFFEGLYEGEHSTTAVDQRAQMYQPLLSGAMGFVFGNNPIWYFGRSGDGNPGWPFSSGTVNSWQTALGSAGSRHAGLVRKFFTGINWPQLRPDTAHRIMTAGYTGASAEQNAVLASSPDNKLAVAYFTSALGVTIDMSTFPAQVTASWYDPTNGNSGAASQYANSGTRTFTPPGANAEGGSDWLLLLRVP